MSKAKYVITGFPSSMNVAKTPSITRSLGPVNKKVANVEAEKGETVVTNMSRGLNNIYEMYGIGGKKHSQGGTPLALPTENKESDGSSFIFSDSKKMLVKDKNVLEWFGIDSKKPMTFADISKTFMKRVNDSKGILINPDSDAVAKRSAEMTMDNTAFKIAALKLLQESKKGFKDGLPNGTEAFFEKLQVNPQEMFAMNQEEADKANTAVAAAFGGLVKNYTPPVEFPSMALGGQLPHYDGGGKVYKQEDLPANAVISSGKTFKVGEFVKQEDGTYRKVTKVNVNPNLTADSKTSTGPIASWIAQDPKNKADADAANAIIEAGIKAGTIKADGKGGIKIQGSFNPGFKERIILSRVINQSGKDFGTDKYKITLQRGTTDYSGAKNGKWQGSGSFVAGFTPEDYEKRYLFEKSRGAGMTDDEAFALVDETYKDPNKVKDLRKEYIGFLGVPAPKTDEELMAPDFYKKNYAAVTQGVEAKLGESGYRPAIGNEQLSGFEHFDAFGFTANPEFEPEGKIVTPPETPPAVTPPVTHLGEEKPLIQPFGYRQQDLNALNRATAARFEIPRLEAWSKTAPIVMPDRAYYSPERNIAAINEQLNQGMQGVKAFASSQNAGADAMALTGQAYANVANAISDYADKNVGVFNSGEQYNTQLANTRAQQEAQQATNMWDKNTMLKQNFHNALSAAKDKIVNLTNQAMTNAADIYKMNLTAENFKMDPRTGLITKVNDKAITPKKATDTDTAKEFTDFASQMPGVTPESAMKLFLAVKSGKYVIEPENGTTTTDELNKFNTQG